MSAPTGDKKTPAHLLPVIYDELRRLAAGYMRQERSGHALQPTALVHEAYLRLAQNTRMEWQGKTHFLAMAATQMRLILVDHARKRGAQKRSGAWKKVTLDDACAVSPQRMLDVLALDEALQRLAELDPRQSQVAELRLFGGLSEAELAEHFGLSERTVRQDWRVARAWLARELAA